MTEKRPVIVCVDDEKIVLDGLKEQLKRRFSGQCSIETVESGEDALELLDELDAEQIEVPVVVSDQIMPGMKGSQLLAKIHETRPAVMKVLLTGQADADAVGEAVNTGGLYRYVAKPWEEDDLVLTLREAMRKYFRERQVEDQRRQLRQLNRELGAKQALIVRLVAGISHEINTPLGALGSASDTIDKTLAKLEQDGGREVPAARQLTAVMRQATDRIARVLAQLRRFVSLDEAEHKVVDIRDCVDAATAVVSAGAPEGVRFDVELGDAPAFVECYPARVSQAFGQVLQNAVEAVDDAGTVAVRLESTGEGVVVAFEDDGPGIDPAQVELVLQPGFTVSAVQTGRVRFGMGLPITKRIVEEAGGRLGIERGAVRGTRVEIGLPRAAQGD